MTTLLLFVLLAGTSDQPKVTRFPIDPSPITLRAEARPRQYLGVVGRRSAWLGSETGEAELWVHPLKLASRFRIDFRIPDYTEPVPGEDVARSIEVRPELTTITYSHATFTVRQHILAPLDQPGLLVLLDVNAIRPLKVVVSFESRLQYAWPGGLGGQYLFWDDDAKAFVLSESLRQHNALIGSPWAETGSDHPAHALPDVPSVFVIPIDPERARTELVPIAVAAAIAPREEVKAAYRKLIAEAGALYRERRQHATDLLDKTTAIDTPDPGLDRAFAWAKVNLDEQLVCNPDLGCGLVAGWGPSGRGYRPGFGWFFGGDAAINSLAMDGIGMWSQVADGLRFLAKHQRADGKIPHEISQAAARLPWFSDFPYTYSHADTTPFFILAAWRYWRASADGGFLSEVWPVIAKAFEWCVAADSDGDGLAENTTGGLGAIEVGAIGKDIHQDIYLAAVSAEAARAVAEMALTQASGDLAERARLRFEKGAQSLNHRYWIEKASHHAFGILAGGAINDTLTVWPATAASFGWLDPAHADRTLARLSAHEITTDWGARLLTMRSPHYGPLEYNMGAVWPFMTGFLSLSHYRYRRPWAAFPLVDALASEGRDWARGRHPELLSGAFYRPLDTAVPQQFFATSMLVTPIVNGLLGFEPDAPRRRARLAPQLPPSWPGMTIRNLRVGEVSIDARFEQKEGGFSAELLAKAGELTVDIDVPVPAGARKVTATLDQVNVPVRLSLGIHDQTVTLSVALAKARRRVDVRWSGGLTISPPIVVLEPGQTDVGLRVLDFHPRPTGWELTAEGVAGRDYEIDLFGEPVTRAVAVARNQAAPNAAVELRAVTAHRQRLHLGFTGDDVQPIAVTIVLDR